jgi:hypothetical protein
MRPRTTLILATLMVVMVVGFLVQLVQLLGGSGS